MDIFVVAAPFGLSAFKSLDTMFWYLLYPLRGTTNPPRLAANHPIRRAFYRHGKTTAQHWLLAMLVSVAIAMGFSYPTIFLAENPTAGFAAYPHHVWTTAKPFDGPDALVDVEMRQVWVHGSYMEALNKDVLKQALEIQKVLVGGEKLTTIFPTLPEKLRRSEISWGYHSPLMYWNSSSDLIDRDVDIFRTINDQKRTPSSLNVALRPASVFAGKTFDRKNLKAADALVMTFMNKIEPPHPPSTAAGTSDVGNKWQQKMKVIKPSACPDCQLFPSDGDVTRNRVYEFSFQPLSLSENLALTFAYSCMAAYVLLSLRRLKAFHSRFGLVVTAITQMTCSVLASFTICGILKINLSMIPQNAYPFVVLVIGLENMFRLINAILAYPATMATDQRIANALGDVGPVSVLTAGQNVLILSFLASFVSPGVAAFCAFACIATLFDAFFLLTFFVAVLNVDIRRLELQDALARSHNQHQRTKSRQRKRSPGKHHQRTWFDALLSGRLPFSTRMAGTAVTTTFILSLNYHFFERHELSSGTNAVRQILGLAKNGPASVADFDTFTPPPMNATLTPGEWMRMQDFDTAREVMRLAKPGADSFVIRVFAPLIVVLAGADRSGAHGGVEEWVDVVKSFAVHHFYPVAVAIVFAVAFVAVLMNFLLYAEASGETDLEDDRFEEAVTVKSIGLPHRLDVVKLSGNEKGHFVTVALDRTIAVSVVSRAQGGYGTFAVPNQVLCAVRWPVRDAAVDEAGQWAAFADADAKVHIYCCATGMITGSLQWPDDHPALLFRFVRLLCGEAMKTHLLVLTSGGRLTMIAVDGGDPSKTSLVAMSLLGATIVDFGTQSRKLYTVTADARLVSFGWNGATWVENAAQNLPLQTTADRHSSPAIISTYEELGVELLVVQLSTNVAFVDSGALVTVGVVKLPESGKLLIGPAGRCRTCGSIALKYLAIASDLPDHKSTLLILAGAHDDDDGDELLCLRANSPSCRSFEHADRTTHELPSAGTWQALSHHGVLGLRRTPAKANTTAAYDRPTSAQMRHRRRASVKPTTYDPSNEWQAYKFGVDGELETAAVSIESDMQGQDMPLYVNNPGPVAGLDSHSIAVAFGNTVKVVRCSRRGSLIGRVMEQTLQRNPPTSKRRLTLRKGQ